MKYTVEMRAIFGPDSAHPEEVQSSEALEATSMKDAAKLARNLFEAGLKYEGIPIEDVDFKVTMVTPVPLDKTAIV